MPLSYLSHSELQHVDTRLVEALQDFPYQPFQFITLEKNGVQLDGKHASLYVEFSLGRPFNVVELIGAGFVDLEVNETGEWSVAGGFNAAKEGNWDDVLWSGSQTVQGSYDRATKTWDFYIG